MEVTTICVPRLKAVLSAVERSQLDVYSIDRNFLEIEDFLEKIKQVKKEHLDVLHQLQRCESGDQQSDVVEVEPFDKHASESREVDLVYLNLNLNFIFI